MPEIKDLNGGTPDDSPDESVLLPTQTPAGGSGSAKPVPKWAVGGTKVEVGAGTVAAPQVLAQQDNQKTYTNEGVGEKAVFTLPSAAAAPSGTTNRLAYRFAVLDPLGIRVAAQAGQTIRHESIESVSGGYIESGDVGSVVALRAVADTEWVVTEFEGLWDVELAASVEFLSRQAVDPRRCDLRISLDAVDPLGVGSSSTLHVVEYVGDTIALEDATGRFRYHHLPNGTLSLSVAGLSQYRTYDLFIYDDGGTPTLEAVPFLSIPLAADKTGWGAPLLVADTGNLKNGSVVSVEDDTGEAGWGTAEALVADTSFYVRTETKTYDDTYDFLVANNARVYSGVDRTAALVSSPAGLVKAGEQHKRYLGTFRTGQGPTVNMTVDSSFATPTVTPEVGLINEYNRLPFGVYARDIDFDGIDQFVIADLPGINPLFYTESGDGLVTAYALILLLTDGDRTIRVRTSATAKANGAAERVFGVRALRGGWTADNATVAFANTELGPDVPVAQLVAEAVARNAVLGGGELETTDCLATVVTQTDPSFPWPLASFAQLSLEMDV